MNSAIQICCGVAGYRPGLPSPETGGQVVYRASSSSSSLPPYRQICPRGWPWTLWIRQQCRSRSVNNCCRLLSWATWHRPRFMWWVPRSRPTNSRSRGETPLQEGLHFGVSTACQHHGDTYRDHHRRGYVYGHCTQPGGYGYGNSAEPRSEQLYFTAQHDATAGLSWGRSATQLGRERGNIPQVRRACCEEVRRVETASRERSMVPQRAQTGAAVPQ